MEERTIVNAQHLWFAEYHRWQHHTQAAGYRWQHLYLGEAYHDVGEAVAAFPPAAEPLRQVLKVTQPQLGPVALLRLGNTSASGMGGGTVKG